MGGRQLAPPLATHQPCQGYYSKINMLLKITGSIDHSPVTFLLNSGAVVSVVCLSALTSKSRNRITIVRLTAPARANRSPLDMVGQIIMPVSIGNFIDYKHGCVVINDTKIPFILKSGVATTPGPSTCDRIISVLHTITIPGRTVQLLDVSLPDAAKPMGLSNILMEPVSTANTPKHVLIARTFSPVFNDNHAVVQTMNISPTATTIYSGTTLGEFTPLTELLLVEITAATNLSTNVIHHSYHIGH